MKKQFLLTIMLQLLGVLILSITFTSKSQAYTFSFHPLPVEQLQEHFEQDEHNHRGESGQHESGGYNERNEHMQEEHHDENLHEHFEGDGHNHFGEQNHYEGDGHNHRGEFSHYEGDGHNHTEEIGHDEGDSHDHANEYMHEHHEEDDIHEHHEDKYADDEEEQDHEDHCAEFEDVKITEAICPGLSMMKNLGIFSGYNDGTFRPHKFLTRAEALAVIIKIVYGPQFSYNESEWFAPYIQFGKIYGIIKGYPDGSLKPHQIVTESEFLIMLSRATYQFGYGYEFSSNKKLTRGEAVEILLSRIGQF